jgi:hypothetical protein
MKFYVVYDPSTGEVRQTGSCRDLDLAGNAALHAANGHELTEHPFYVLPDQIVVDLATKKAKPKPGAAQGMRPIAGEFIKVP